jgi:hypothetical protein
MFSEHQERVGLNQFPASRGLPWGMKSKWQIIRIKRRRSRALRPKVTINPWPFEKAAAYYRAQGFIALADSLLRPNNPAEHPPVELSQRRRWF